MRRTILAAGLATFLLPAVALAAGTSMSPVVSSKLSGKTEVPKGDRNGTGIVVLHLNATKRRACWKFKGIKNIGRPQAAHIHKGARGVAGPIVVPLGGAYKAKGCATAAKKVIVAIEEHPNRYYVNIHNAKYPAGAIRGQLVAGMIGG
ncbi:MAG: CHRD domain-containing protein [Actinomycetota bacterium]|nr:CHRD domain-containing protein [Actinomycetota bacterium]